MTSNIHANSGRRNKHANTHSPANRCISCGEGFRFSSIRWVSVSSLNPDAFFTVIFRCFQHHIPKSSSSSTSPAHWIYTVWQTVLLTSICILAPLRTSHVRLVSSLVPSADLLTFWGHPGTSFEYPYLMVLWHHGFRRMAWVDLSFRCVVYWFLLHALEVQIAIPTSN